MAVPSLLLFALHAVHGLAAATGRNLRRSPLSLTGQRIDSDGAKLIPWTAKKQWARSKQRQRMHMLAHAVSSGPKEEDTKPIEGCIACFGAQVVYGKYQTEDGDQSANSYYLFRNPSTKRKDENTTSPIIIHFHHGGLFSGSPWKKEDEEIKSYLSNGFAVVSVGYRLVTEKYFYEAKDGENRTEELIHVSKDGRLSLDENRTMETYQVRVGKQELITKYLFDATQMMEHLIENADKFGLDIHRIVFVGESVGGAGMQYLTWIYHKFNVGRYTPRGMVYQNAQLNYPVHNMLDQTWDLFVQTMGAKTKLSDVVSPEACPTIIGNHMCGSPLGEASDYELCNHVWNQNALKRFCGEGYKSATLGEVQLHQQWPTGGEEDEVGSGMEQLWYNSENMQKHVPHEPFHIYVANSMNGTGAADVAHHSVFALNFAKFAEMGKGGIEYTVYYSDFAHMTKEDRGMERVEVSSAPGDLGLANGLALPAAASAPVAAAGPGPAASPMPGLAGPAPAPLPAPASAPAPAPFPAREKPTHAVLNYLSTHGWRDESAAKDVVAGSSEERILYACLAAGAGPFQVFPVKPNKTDDEPEKEKPKAGWTLKSMAMATLVGALVVVGVVACICSSAQYF